MQWPHGAKQLEGAPLPKQMKPTLLAVKAGSTPAATSASRVPPPTTATRSCGAFPNGEGGGRWLNVRSFDVST